MTTEVHQRPADGGTDRRRAPRRDLANEKFRVAPIGVTYLVMIGWFLVVAAPIVWLVVTSVRSRTEYLGSTVGWPREPQWQNYADAWRIADFSTYLPNSVIYTTAIVVGVTVVGSLAGYGLARFEFRSRIPIIVAFLIAIAIPFHSIMFGVYDLVDALGLLGTRIGVILPVIALMVPFASFYMRAFFTRVPFELAEAARIDGAGEGAIFVRIMLPLARPGLTTLAVFSGVWSWGMYLEPLLLASSSRLRTVALGLSFFTTEYGGTNQPVVAAAVVIIVLPMVVASILLQRKFIEGVTGGSSR